jgi:hypothetical protein
MEDGVVAFTCREDAMRFAAMVEAERRHADEVRARWRVTHIQAYVSWRVVDVCGLQRHLELAGFARIDGVRQGWAPGCIIWGTGVQVDRQGYNPGRGRLSKP